MKFDLVILDLMMFDMMGFEVCINICERFSMVELLVFIVMAVIISYDKYKVFYVGVNDIL